MTARRTTTLGPRDRFREILAGREMIAMPGGFSPLYAVMAERTGFQAFFVAGSQVSAYLYGLPDVGIIGLRDMVDHVRHVQARTSIPVLADADTGYGNAVSTYFTVQEFLRSGVAGIQIEDQEAPKKSGTSSGRRLISIDEAVGKYKAATRARDELDPKFVVCARCDAIGAEDGGFENAVERCIRYVTEGGADLVWLNSIASLEDLSLAVKRIPAPVLTVWGGSNPAPTLEEFRATGVRIVLYPVLASSAGLQAAWSILNDFAERGTPALQDWSARVDDVPWGKGDLQELITATRVETLEAELLPAQLQRDYRTTYGHADSTTSHVVAPTFGDNALG